MKIFSLIAAMLFFQNFARTQFVQVDTKSKSYRSMLNHKLTVVESDSSDYNEALHEAFDNYWEVSEVEYISMAEFENVKLDTSKTFFYAFRWRGERDRYLYYIINGGKTYFYYNQAIVYSPLALFNGENDLTQSTYRLNYIAKGLNDAIQDLKDNKYSEQFEKSLETVNEGFLKIAESKTLVINEETRSIAYKQDFGPTTSPAAFENYPYKYKFVKDEEFREILASDSKEYICLVPLIEFNKHFLIYETSSKKTVYYGWKLQGMKIESKDVKCISLGKYR